MPLSPAEKKYWLAKMHSDHRMAWLLNVHETPLGYQFIFEGLNQHYYDNVPAAVNLDIIGNGPEAYGPKTANLIHYRYNKCAVHRISYSYRERLLIGGWEWWDSTLEPIIHDGKVLGIYGHCYPATEKVAIEQELRRSLESGSGLFMEYQPIKCLRTFETAGKEALIRWASYGASPQEWLAIAKDAGLMPAINAFVINEVGRALRVIPDKKQWISINIDTFQIEAALAAAATDWNVNPNRFSIEISERATLDKAALTELGRIHVKGSHIKIDDWGTERSGFSRLTQLLGYVKPCVLKCDRQFITNVHQSLTNQSICESIIVLAHKLGIGTIAEGVETDDELRWCQDAGFDFAQGWHPKLGKATAI